MNKVKIEIISEPHFTRIKVDNKDCGTIGDSSTRIGAVIEKLVDNMDLDNTEVVYRHTNNLSEIIP